MKRLVLAASLAASPLFALDTPPAVQWPPFPEQARLTLIASYTGASAPSDATGWIRFLHLLLGIAGLGKSTLRPLSHPTGIFVRGRIVYVADPGEGGVLRYDEAAHTSVWLPSPGWKTKWGSPIAVAAAPDGRVFVADSELERVFILNPEGSVLGELKGDPRGLGRPAGLALGFDRLYVSDARNHRISFYDLGGSFIGDFGRRGAAVGEFNYPTYLWFDGSARQLWVCDSGNFRLQRFDEDGRSLGSIGENGDRPGYLARPRGVALDSEGNVYVVDGAFDAVQIFDGKGRLLLFAGAEGAEPGQFSLPGGIFIDANDRVFVADTYNGRVEVFQYRKAGEQR